MSGQKIIDGLQEAIAAERHASDVCKRDLQARIEALEAQIEAADRLAGFAQGVVDRWDSRDWRSGYTSNFITKHRHAIAAYRAAKEPRI